MLSRLLSSRCHLLLKKLPPEIGVWTKGKKNPILGLVKYCSGGIASYYVIKHSILVAKCDRLRTAGPRSDIGPYRRLAEDPVPVDWKDFFCMLWDQRWYIIIAFSSALIVAWINIQIPHLIGNFVDLLTTSKPSDFISKLGPPTLQCVKLYLVQALATFTYIVALSISAERMAHRLREKYFTSMMNQAISFYDTRLTGEILSRLTSDIQDFKSCFKQAFSQGLRSFSQSIGCIYSIYLISPPLAKFMIIIIPTVICIGTTLGQFLRKMSNAAQRQEIYLGSIAEEAFSNIRCVKSFAMEETESRLHLRESQKLKERNTYLAGGIGVFQAGSNLFLNGIVLSILYFGGQRISTNELSAGNLMTFMVASQTIQKSLGNLSQVYGVTIKGLSSLARVQEFIRLDKGPRVGKRFAHDHLIGDIEFKNVVFQYPGRPPVLRNLSLKLPEGKVTALIGGSGSGKSTMVGLFQALHPASEGKVIMNGVDVQDIDHTQLNSEMIGVIGQEPILFATSIFENIRYGKPNATAEEVYEAAKKANAYDFITAFPKGFQTVLGEKGVTISGGQKQRIAIARALIKDPAFLILDEATSALDTESETLIKETLDAEMKGRTVLIIAHRLSTIKHADMIAVLEDGKIAESGSHDELISRKGLYYHLVKAQHIFFD